MSIKFDYNMPQICFTEVIELMHKSYPADNYVPKNYSELKKKVQSLGLDVQMIDNCHYDCMLYFKENLALGKFCGLPRWKPKKSGDNRKKLNLYVKMFYFPLTPRLQCLCVLRNTAEYMR